MPNRSFNQTYVKVAQAVEFRRYGDGEDGKWTTK